MFQRKKDANEVIRHEVRRLQGLKAMTINVYARKNHPEEEWPYVTSTPWQ